MKARRSAGALTGATGAASAWDEADNNMTLPTPRAGGLAGLSCTAFRDVAGRRCVTIDRPPCHQRALDRAVEQDRRYFAANPTATEYVRRYVPGEFYPLLPADVRRVLVTQLAPGFRMRSPIFDSGRQSAGKA